MAWDWKVGDKVVCVNGEEDHPLHGSDTYRMTREFVRTGETYTIAGFSSCNGHLTLYIVECDRSHYANDYGFLAARFRPVRKTDISSLVAHLTSVPDRVLEDVR